MHYVAVTGDPANRKECALLNTASFLLYRILSVQEILIENSQNITLHTEAHILQYI